MMLTDLAAVCRKAGLKVQEVDGWRRRGHGNFAAVTAIVCHHTAGPASGNMPSLGVVTNGRPGLDGPLCNLGLGRDGTVYVVAAGVAWHAGVVTQTTFDNWHAIGIEAEATGVNRWPDAQMDAYARLCKALAAHYKVPLRHILGHKEVCKPAGRKIDPNFSMSDFRARIANARLGDDVSAEDVWNHQIPKQGGKDGETQAAKWALAQARQRATVGMNAAQQARSAAREALSVLGDVAKLGSDTTLSDDARAALATDIAHRVAKAIERLDAEALAEQLEVTVKEEK